ncbi:MAG: hypothetical protein Greene041619_46 [Candidatus Peregrinibacteria bacterium Greene0416_19]|nr:MAG: hypothetical protein Greene041619_46 [Candidatus Peregrinibacteria bacterium Greene0416_19]
MANPYHALLPRLFKGFSIATARRTLLPTLGYYLRRPQLPPSEKPALFTMNILPPMMTVWHHCARKYLGDRVDIVIFDCSGELNPKDFPGARVQKFLNFYAATKSDEFLYRIARNRRIGWLCDDDIFFVSGKAVDLVERELAVPKTASVSFRPRTWWHFRIGGEHHWPSSSYCIAYNRGIFCDWEKLSLAPADGNANPFDSGKAPGRYDTGDKANEILLKKGYRCFIVPKEQETDYITGFSGMSGAVMLLRYFKKPDETLDWFRSAPDKAWSGNILFGTFSALLAARTIQECHKVITGKDYPLPSLPSRMELEKLRKEKERIMPEYRSFGWIDEAGERLHKAL